MNRDNMKNTLALIIDRLQVALQPEQIILFGSHAYGEPGEGSDLDLLIVVSDSSLPSHHRSQIVYRCVGAVGVPKDLVVLTRDEFERQLKVATSLARRAREKGKVLYDRRETYGSTEMVDQESA